MTAYETVFILRPDLGDELVGKTCDRITSLVGANEGAVITLEKVGNRRLAYEVKDQKDGYYIILNYEGQPGTTRELERFFKISDEVIRYLIVKKEAASKAAPTAKEQSPAADEAATPGEAPPTAEAATIGEASPTVEAATTGEASPTVEAATTGEAAEPVEPAQAPAEAASPETPSDEQA